jgi:hypothetical protein
MLGDTSWKKNQGDRVGSRLAVISITFGLSSSGAATAKVK